MSTKPSFLVELHRRNVLRAGLLYIGAIWALAQGISQLGPSFGAPEWFTRWFRDSGGDRVSDLASVRVVLRMDAAGFQARA